MLEKWKSDIDNRQTFGALLTNSHDLLTGKLNTYGLAALRLVQNYLSNCKQRTKINSDFSSREEILFGVPQGSILRPLLLNIILCDLFFIMNVTDVGSYALCCAQQYRRCHYQFTKCIADTFPVVLR